MRQRGVGEGGEPSRDRLLSFMNTHQAITRHWPNVVLMLCRRRRRRATIRTTLGQCLVFAGLPSQLISKLESLTQCLQHWADISPALAYQYIGLNKINAHPMLAYCWPIFHDHGSAVKQHWLKVSFLQGTPATRYTAVFHLAISNMAQRHAAFCERHVMLPFRCAMLPFEYSDSEVPH